MIGRLLRFDAMDMTFREYKIPRDAACPVCGKTPTITKLIDYEQFCGLGRGEGISSTADRVAQQSPVQDSDDIEVEQIKAMLDRKEDFVYVDVRNPAEFDICSIPGTAKLPLPEFPQRYQELPKDKLIVLHCHHGGRSLRALKFLRTQGYPRLKNVPGGIDAWAERIDPDMPRY